jgi:uncharacterized Fe-S cluster-containing MiaB family protein
MDVKFYVEWKMFVYVGFENEGCVLSKKKNEGCVLCGYWIIKEKKHI